MRRQTRLGVNVESIDHLLIVYLNGQAGRDWCTHISECVWIYIYMVCQVIMVDYNT